MFHRMLVFSLPDIETQVQLQICFELVSSFVSKLGAHFTKHLKPKIFVSSIQTVWELLKS